MINRIKKLTVRYNEKEVGNLVEMQSEKIAFQYSEGFIKDGFSISPFSLPLEGKVFINEKPLFNGLYGVFKDSLPDGWGELLLKRNLAKHGVNFDRIGELTKLALISESGLGGLSYEPTLAEEKAVANYNLDLLSRDANEIFDGSVNEVDLDSIYIMGGSSGGARPKAHIKINNESYIIKFHCRIDPIDAGKKEYEANELAKKAGIRVNEFKLFASHISSGHFGAKRFDRENGRRKHVISLSALLETTHKVPNLDYMHFMQVTEKLCGDKEEMYEAFRRMCFNVLYENKDDHGKNFAYIYDDVSGYKLSPAFDITKTQNKFEHEMTVVGNPQPKTKDLMEVCKLMKLKKSKCEEIIEIISSIIGKQ